MAIIANQAIFLNDAVLTIVADDYTAGVSTAELVPNTPIATFVDIGGNVQQFAGKPTWTFNLSHAQDWTTASSLSKYLQANQGTVKAATLQASDGSDIASFDMVIVPGNYGGAAAAVLASTVSLPVNGQPVIEPGA